ncbi:MAG: hypothetical protein ACYC0V_18845 [Armatimonadota bacterium]
MFDPIQDDPNLPRVLLIGDSISIGYTMPVRNQLAGKANVHRIPTNGMFSANGLENIKEWLGNSKWDVIHFNWGIWDTHLLAADGSILTAEDEKNGKPGSIRTTIFEYEANLGKLVDIMLASGAKLIWASSTPVTCRSGNRIGDIDRYNLAASAVMKKKGVIIDDLNSYIKPHLKEMQMDDGCHFRPVGDELLGKIVAECIISALGTKIWQPDNFDAAAVSSQTISGRNVIRFEHDCLKQWGYTDRHKQYFYIIEPKVRSCNPLMVCLHSAGGTGESELASNMEKIAGAGDEFAGLVLNSGDESEWWWGAHEIDAHPDLYKSKPTPVEARVLATVEWAIRRYSIDRNRIYLRGISMGGSGTLGIGMPNGDIFAAIQAGVPAGTKHALHRLNNASLWKSQPEMMESAPPVFVFFSQKDDWSKGMEEWLDFVHENKISVLAAWGPWGHENHYEMTNPAAYQFPWLDIRKDQAYPSFTNASSDDKYPGFKSDANDQNGQMNAYFRWKVLEDNPNSFAIELRLVTNEELGVSIDIPKQVVSDVTIRRLQRISVTPGHEYKWSIEKDGSVMKPGTIIADGGLITIKGVEISSEPIIARIVK